MRKAGLSLLILTSALYFIAGAAASEAFRFNPPDGLTIAVTSKTTTLKTISNKTTAEIVSSRDEIVFNKTGYGYDITYRSLSSSRTTNAEEDDEFMSSVSDILDNATIIYKVDSSGRIIDIEGIDLIAEQIRTLIEEHYPEAVSVMGDMLAGIEESIIEESINEWKYGIETFLGRSSKAGSIWKTKKLYNMPIGEPLTGEQTVKIQKQVKKNGLDCVQVTYSGILDEQSASDSLNSWATKMSRGIPENYVPSIKKASIIALESEVLDPKTMLCYQESSYEATDITVDVPGHGEERMSVQKTSLYAYEYGAGAGN